MSTNVKIVEFGDYIGIIREKYIQISSNMPGTGLEKLWNFRNFEKQNDFVWMVKPIAATIPVNNRMVIFL